VAWYNSLERCCDGQDIVDAETFRSILMSVSQQLQMTVHEVDYACVRGLLSNLDVVGCVRTSLEKIEHGYEVINTIEHEEWFETVSVTVVETDKGSLWMDPVSRDYSEDIDDIELNLLPREGDMLFEFSVPVPCGNAKSFAELKRQIDFIRLQINNYASFKEGEVHGAESGASRPPDKKLKN